MRSRRAVERATHVSVRRQTLDHETLQLLRGVFGIGWVGEGPEGEREAGVLHLEVGFAVETGGLNVAGEGVRGDGSDGSMSAGGRGVVVAATARGVRTLGRLRASSCLRSI